jgi:hypothetical protein
MNLGEILIEQGLITESELQIVLREQARSNQPFGKVCRNMGLISNRQIVEALSRQYRMPIIETFEGGQAVIDETTARKLRVLPTVENGQLVFATEDPTRIEVVETLKRLLTEKKIQLRLADSAFIEHGFGLVYGDQLAIDHLMSSQNENRFLEMVDRILAHAARAGVSDIHFIPQSAEVGQKISAAGVVSTYSLVYTAARAYSGGVLAPNGDIHFVVHEANRGQKISAAGVVSTYSLVYTNANNSVGGVLNSTGDIYFIPFGLSSFGQKISTCPAIPFPSDVCLSSYLNKF